MTRPAPRQDVFVSIAFSEPPREDSEIRATKALADQLAREFRYLEVLIMVDADESHTFEYLLGIIPNLRLLKIRHGTPFYRRRVAVASETIGDLIVLASSNEIESLNVSEMLAAAETQDAIVMARRAGFSLIDVGIRTLGSTAGFRVSSLDLLTSAFPRSLLNQILAHPDREMALRFPPADDSIPIVLRMALKQTRPKRTLAGLGRRLNLVQRLLVSTAPRVLGLVSLASILVTISGLAFSIYALVVWLTRSNVQPGWTSSSVLVSLTAAFLGMAIFGLSIGLQKVLDLLASDPAEDVLGEQSAVDLFSQVMQELNVEVDTPPLQMAKPQTARVAVP